MIANCIILNCEIHLLIARLRLEWPLYDKFLIFESNKLFNGNLKPLYFERYRYLFTDYLSKIDYHVVTDMPDPIRGSYIGTLDLPANENRWVAEAHMRNAALNATHDFLDSDILVFQDVDEIASRLSLEKATQFLSRASSQQLPVYKFAYHNFKGGLSDCHYNSLPFRGAFAVQKRIFRYSSDLTPHSLRLAYELNGSMLSWEHVPPTCLVFSDNSPVCRSVDVSDLLFHWEDLSSHSGWHLSSLNFGIDLLEGLKSESFSHSEYHNPDVSSSIYEIDPVEVMTQKLSSATKSFWTEQTPSPLAPLPIIDYFQSLSRFETNA